MQDAVIKAARKFLARIDEDQPGVASEKTLKEIEDAKI